MAAEYTFDPGLVFNDVTLEPTSLAVGQLFASADSTSPAQAYDLQGTPLAALSTNSAGYLPRFRADIPLGVVRFGTNNQPVASVEALRAGLEAQSALETIGGTVADVNTRVTAFGQTIEAQTEALQDVSLGGIPRYTSTANRSAAFAAAEEQPQPGMMGALLGVPMTYGLDGVWRHIVPLDIENMSRRPTSNQGRYTGMRVKPADRPNLVFVYTGSLWVQEGLDAMPEGTIPPGAYVSSQSGSVVLRPSNSAGGTYFAIPRPFSAPPMVTLTSGDWINGFFQVAPIGEQMNGNTVACQARNFDGVPINDTQTIRINYRLIGYNV